MVGAVVGPRPRQRVADVAVQVVGGLGAGRAEEGELVTVEAADHIAVAGHRAQGRGDVAKDLRAGILAVVVD